MSEPNCPDCFEKGKEIELKRTNALWVLPPMQAAREQLWLESEGTVLHCKCGFKGIEWEAVIALAKAVAEDAPPDSQFQLRLPKPLHEAVRALANVSKQRINSLFVRYIAEGLQRELEQSDDELDEEA